MTPEGLVKAALKKYLASLGEDCWYSMPTTFGYGKSGVPDFVICYKGHFMAPETKKVGGKGQKWQDDQQEQIRVAGGMSGRVDNVEMVMAWVRSIDGQSV